MASAFDHLTTTLQIAKLRWPDGRRGQWLLWPVWMRQVAAPARPSTRLGPFERAILGCARARIADAEHIGTLLSIDRKLVKIIQQSLFQQGVLDSHSGITIAGMEALELGEVEAADINVVHIFQCGITGLVMPRITNQLYFADVIRRDGGMEIETGSVADSNRRRCITIRPPQADEPPIPGANEVLTAIRRHFFDLRSRSTGGADSTHPAANEPRPHPTALKRVNFIGLHAIPVFLATVAYATTLESDDTNGEDWRIADPFGLGESRRLLEDAERFRVTDADFDRQVRQLTRKPMPATTSGDTVDATLVWQMAKDEVATKLPDRFRTWRGHDHLVGMEDSYLWVGESKNNAQRNTHLRRSARAARDAFEACFASLSDIIPLSPLKGRVATLKNTPADERFLQEKVALAAQRCGLTCPIPKRFAVRPRDMWAVIAHGNFYKLGAVVSANLLLAGEQADHPLLAAIQSRPALLEDLDRAFGIAGEASHDSGGAVPDPAEIDFLIATLYWLVETLLAGAAVSAPGATQRHT